MVNYLQSIIKPKKKKKKKSASLGANQFELQAMVVPGIIFLIIFSLIPMIGIIIGFRDYNVLDGFFAGKWVGLKYIKELFTDEAFPMIMKNTLGMNALGLFLGFPAPIIFALLLNELPTNIFKKGIQTLSYMPHFVSWAIYGGIISAMLAPSLDGFINKLLMSLGLLDAPIQFLGDPKYFWGVLTSAGILKAIGWGSIIYIAAISSVGQELYESAALDGVNRIQKMWYITLPSIMGTVVIMLIFAISGILNSGIDQTLVLQNTMNYTASETIDMYVYHVGISNARYSYSTAVGFLKSIIGLTLLLGANYFSKQVSENSLF